MPSPSQFKKAFDLETGCALGTSGAVVMESRIGHEMKRPGALYHFPSTLRVKWSQTRSLSTIKLKLSRDLFHLKEKSCLAYSAYGSPYTCSISKAKVSKVQLVDKTATIEFLGIAKRRKDLPKLSAGLEGEDPQWPGSEQAIDILEHNGMRIVKSRFATSSCPLCIQKILPGSQVAKQVSDHKRGGWVHVACALKTVNPGPVKHSTKLAK